MEREGSDYVDVHIQLEPTDVIISFSHAKKLVQNLDFRQNKKGKFFLDINPDYRYCIILLPALLLKIPSFNVLKASESEKVRAEQKLLEEQVKHYQDVLADTVSLHSFIIALWIHCNFC